LKQPSLDKDSWLRAKIKQLESQNEQLKARVQLHATFSGHKVQPVKFANDEQIEQCFGFDSMVNAGYLERIAELASEIKIKDDKIH
jgi:hypothetical protein